MEKKDLRELVLEALKAEGGEGTVVQVAKHVWKHHERELRNSGDLFYTWQYDIRWAAQRLRDEGFLEAKHGERRGSWKLR